MLICTAVLAITFNDAAITSRKSTLQTIPKLDDKLSDDKFLGAVTPDGKIFSGDTENLLTKTIRVAATPVDITHSFVTSYPFEFSSFPTYSAFETQLYSTYPTSEIANPIFSDKYYNTLFLDPTDGIISEPNFYTNGLFLKK